MHGVVALKFFFIFKNFTRGYIVKSLSALRTVIWTLKNKIRAKYTTFDHCLIQSRQNVCLQQSILPPSVIVLRHIAIQLSTCPTTYDSNHRQQLGILCRSRKFLPINEITTCCRRKIEIAKKDSKKHKDNNWKWSNSTIRKFRGFGAHWKCTLQYHVGKIVRKRVLHIIGISCNCKTLCVHWSHFAIFV